MNTEPAEMPHVGELEKYGKQFLLRNVNLNGSHVSRTRNDCLGAKSGVEGKLDWTRNRVNPKVT